MNQTPTSIVLGPEAMEAIIKSLPEETRIDIARQGLEIAAKKYMVEAVGKEHFKRWVDDTIRQVDKKVEEWLKDLGKTIQAPTLRDHITLATQNIIRDSIDSLVAKDAEVLRMHYFQKVDTAMDAFLNGEEFDALTERVAEKIVGRISFIYPTIKGK